MRFENEEDREDWEEEQKRLDREWYSIDDGVDENSDPFAGTSDEYVKKREQQLEQRQKKKMSERQRQIHKVSILFIQMYVVHVFCSVPVRQFALVL